jgi:glycine reductase complex component B subunit alpha and beta
LPTLADLEIATFAVDEVVEGTQTGRSDRRLSVSLPQLAVGAGEPALAEATVEVVRPGDPVRITNVLDAVLPSVKAEDPAATFPGVLGPLALAGRGRTHRLDGAAVLSTCDWGAAREDDTSDDTLPDAFVDMAGPGAQLSRYGATTNLVVVFRPSCGAPGAEVDQAVRRETLRVARELAATTLGDDPDTVEAVRLPAPGEAVDPSLPAVAAILQVASEGTRFDTFLYGKPLGGIVPTLIDPREVIDGALTNGAYDWACVRNHTATYQRAALVREMLAAHGRRLRFAGLILALGYLDTAREKQRGAILSARLAAQLGADGCVCTTFSSGNSHTDTMLTVRECERLGIRATALVCETDAGLTDHVAEADSLVSTGNEDELVESWKPERIVGGDADARVGEPVPTWAYLGACVQTGDERWTAMPA